MHRSLAFVPLVAFAAAAPQYGSSLSTGKAPYEGGGENSTKYEATFDDLTPIAGGLVSVQEVGPYDGLDYQAINLITLGLDGTTVIGVNPRSSPNVGAYSDRSTALDGDAPPKITTQYVGSVTDTFDFDSFYFGCVLATGEAVGSLPKPCTVTVVGYKASIEVARQDFEFDPGTLTVNVDMVKAELNDKFRGIDTATFDTEGGELGSVESVLVATLLDDLKYTVYDAKDKKEGEEYDGGDEMENEEDHGLVSSLSEVL